MKTNKPWTIILTTDPKKPIKQFRLPKSFVYVSLSFLLLLFVLISGLSYFLNEYVHTNQDLYSKLEVKTKEVEAITIDYVHLQQETITVQQSIEEFKQFEEQLSNLNLTMPTHNDSNQDGSGGLLVDLELYDSREISSNLLEMKQELPELIARFEETVERITEYEKELRTVPTIFPAAEGRISSHYGKRRDPFTWRSSFHTGTDIAAPLNTPIFAAADGTVTFAGRNGGYGETIIIEHGNTYETLYAHLNRIDVEVGDEVSKGDIIGGMGTTGRSTGVHLHYEVKRNGDRVDPYVYMTFHDRSE
ncbi:MAG: M23 family metallopeptidase [Bacillaceae bacterium]|nr:M23 family metallopeptidase [Bacillaceae bacterium]